MRYILLFLLLIILLIFLMPIKIKFKFKNESKYFYAELVIYFFYISFFTIKMHYKRIEVNEILDFSVYILGVRKFYKTNLEDTKSKKTFSININKIIPKKLIYKRIESFSYTNVLYFLSFVKNNLKNTVFNKFKFSLVLGFQDAAYTAIANGAMWGIFYSAFMPIYNNSKFTTIPEINIIPYYGNTKIDIDLVCILNIKCGNIIINSIKLFKNIKWR
ncbi:MAG: DUF2953 domain-containing protein [Thermoanaerobacteraceae bacterium]